MDAYRAARGVAIRIAVLVGAGLRCQDFAVALVIRRFEVLGVVQIFSALRSPVLVGIGVRLGECERQRFEVRADPLRVALVGLA